MDRSDIVRRAEDLSKRCVKTGTVTASRFLTPAEQVEIADSLRTGCGFRIEFFGGREHSERKVAFFIPDSFEGDYNPFDAVKIIRLQACYGEPSHRDYLGALMGMGVERDCIGDIEISADTAYVFCIQSVLSHLVTVEKVGKYTVRVSETDASQMPEFEVKTKASSFTVMSMRLDAVVSGMFGISRTEAVRHIHQGNVFLNYRCNDRPDARIAVDDVLSVKGVGKGKVTAVGGVSRKGRLFIRTETFK